MLVERMRPFTSTIFAEMSALAAAHRRDQPRPGLPRHRRPAVAARRRRREHHRRGQPVPAGPRASRRCAPPWPSTSAASTASTSTRTTCSSPPARPRRSRPRCWRCASRATRSSTFEPYYDSYAATIALAGAMLRHRAAARRRPSASTPTSCAPRSPPRTRLVLVNTPHNPTGAVFDREQLTLIGELAAEHDAVVVTDEVYEHMTLRRAAARPDGHAAGHGRAHADDLLGRQDVLGHRLEGRLGARAAASWSRRCGRPSSSSPTSAGAPFQPAIAAALGAARRLLRRPGRRPAAQARPARPTGLRAAGFTVFPHGGHVLRRHRRRAARRSTTAPSSAGGCRS